MGLAVAAELNEDMALARRQEKVIEFYRRYTTRINNQTIINLIVNFLSALYYTKVFPILFNRICHLIPEVHPDPQWRKCYIHHYLTALRRERQNPDKLAQFLKKLGAKDVLLHPGPEVRLIAKKP